MSKRMKLPNGFGQITRLKNNRLRKPYRAMVTVGRAENGRPICKLLKPQSYFYTYNDAFAALVEYNRVPFDLSTELSLEALYEKWSAGYFNGVQLSRIQATKAAWKYCAMIKHMRVRDIRARHIKGVLDEGCINIAGKVRYPSIHTRMQIKTMFNMMFDYALEYELVEKNFARTFNISREYSKISDSSRKPHIIFTDEEMSVLWRNAHHPYVAAILIQCYSGWRPGELISLKLSDVNLEENTLRGGLKTDAGKSRVVPIHKKILPLVRMLYTIAVAYGGNNLLNCIENKLTTPMTYSKYQKRFKGICDKLGLSPQHRPHDPRKQFITMAKRACVDEYVIKRLVGHTIDDVTESVYTDRDIEWLRREIEKI